MFLCRRWGNSCQISSSSLPRSCRWLPSRLSKCRRSCLMMFLCDVPVATRSWWNSWWKCRRFSTSSSNGFRSRSTTIQFRMVVVELLEVFKAFSLDLWSRPLTFQLHAVVFVVFKVFSQNRVQLRLLLRLWNAFLSGMWSRSLFLVGLVKALKIFSQDRVHPLLLTIQLVFLKLWMSLVKGFFSLFPIFIKARHNLRTRGRHCLRTRAHGRRLLVTRPWCLRRKTTSLTLPSSTWSVMGACGGASGSQLASSIAGGTNQQPTNNNHNNRDSLCSCSYAYGHGKDIGPRTGKRCWVQRPTTTTTTTNCQLPTTSKQQHNNTTTQQHNNTTTQQQQQQ